MQTALTSAPKEAEDGAVSLVSELAAGSCNLPPYRGTLGTIAILRSCADSVGMPLSST